MGNAINYYKGHPKEPIFTDNGAQIGFVTTIGNRWFSSECYKRKGEIHLQSDAFCITMDSKEDARQAIYRAYYERQIARERMQQRQKQRQKEARDMLPKKDLFNVNTIAVAFDVSRNLICSAAKKIKVAKKNGKYMFTVDDVEKIGKLVKKLG
jgi:hypothetical protein